MKTNPPPLTKLQESFIKLIVAADDDFPHWASKAQYPDGTLLFGPERGAGSLYEYCRKVRFKSVKRSFESFLAGSRRSTWVPLTRQESNPLVHLKAIEPIRCLTEEEFNLQSIQRKIMAPRSPNRGNRGRSTTPVRAANGGS